MGSQCFYLESFFGEGGWRSGPYSTPGKEDKNLMSKRDIIFLSDPGGCLRSGTIGMCTANANKFINILKFILLMKYNIL